MGAVSADVDIDKTAVKTGPDTATVNLTVTGTGTATSSAADVVFAIDSSGSMSSSDPTNLRLTASQNFIDQMDPTKDQAGAVDWDDTVEGTQPLTNNFAQVKTFIGNIDASGGTDLDGGLNAAINVMNSGAKPSSSHVIIFLTDGGGSYTPSGQPGSPADNAASLGYVIYSVGLGQGVYAPPLQDMATATGGQYYFAADASALDPIFNAIFQQINTAATNVVVTDVLPSYMQLVGDPSILPDSKVTNTDGTTTLVWNVGTLNVGQIWSVKYNLRSTRYGIDLPTNVAGLSGVSYTDPADAQRTTALPVPLLNFENPETVSAANTIGMLKTGTPLAGIALAILMVLGGFVGTRKK